MNTIPPKDQLDEMLKNRDFQRGFHIGKLVAINNFVTLGYVETEEGETE